jgi:hypothetical protein
MGAPGEPARDVIWSEHDEAIQPVPERSCAPSGEDQHGDHSHTEGSGGAARNTNGRLTQVTHQRGPDTTDEEGAVIDPDIPTTDVDGRQQVQALWSDQQVPRRPVVPVQVADRHPVPTRSEHRAGVLDGEKRVGDSIVVGSRVESWRRSLSVTGTANTPADRRSYGFSHSKIGHFAPPRSRAAYVSSDAMHRPPTGCTQERIQQI